jgi:hypothetical protein
MPIGFRLWRWSAREWSRTAGIGRLGLVIAYVIAWPIYALYGPFVFDAVYWILGKAAKARIEKRGRIALSIGVAVVYVIVIGLSVSTGRVAAAPGTSPLSVAVGSNPSSSPITDVTSTPTLSPATPSPSTGQSTTSASASMGDSDDEGAASPGASFVPDATGAVAPPPQGGSPSQRLPGEPDAALTPGALNPAVTQATIGATICVTGWTAIIRPSSSYTTALKIQQIPQYGYTDTRTSSYEEDHLISLELGGAPADPRNLWPEPYTSSLPDGRPTGARTKDVLETRLKKEVCAGTTTLAEAQRAIGVFWVHAYYGIPFTTALPTTPPAGGSPASTPVPATLAPSIAPPPADFAVTFASLPSPAPLGGTATIVAHTTPAATCLITVTWPSGNKSTASGLKTNPTAGSDGNVSWTWNVASTTTPGTAKTTVTCALGGTSTQASANFTVA